MYQLINGKFYQTKELTEQEVLELLNSSKPTKKLEFEEFDLGKPNSPNVWICNKGEEVDDGVPAAWDNGYGEWLYNWWGAVEECKYLGKRMPTNEEFDELLKTKDDMPNIAYAGYCSGGTCLNRGSNAYYWSASVYAPSPTYSWYRNLNYTTASVYRHTNAQSSAFSVRCLKG